MGSIIYGVEKLKLLKQFEYRISKSNNYFELLDLDISCDLPIKIIEKCYKLKNEVENLLGNDVLNSQYKDRYDQISNNITRIQQVLVIDKSRELYRNALKNFSKLSSKKKERLHLMNWQEIINEYDSEHRDLRTINELLYCINTLKNYRNFFFTANKMNKINLISAENLQIGSNDSYNTIKVIENDFAIKGMIIESLTIYHLLDCSQDVNIEDMKTIYYHSLRAAKLLSKMTDNKQLRFSLNSYYNALDKLAILLNPDIKSKYDKELANFYKKNKIKYNFLQLTYNVVYKFFLKTFNKKKYKEYTLSQDLDFFSKDNIKKEHLQLLRKLKSRQKGESENMSFLSVSIADNHERNSAFKTTIESNNPSIRSDKSLSHDNIPVNHEVDSRKKNNPTNSKANAISSKKNASLNITQLNFKKNNKGF